MQSLTVWIFHKAPRIKKKVEWLPYTERTLKACFIFFWMRNTLVVPFSLPNGCAACWLTLPFIQTKIIQRALATSRPFLYPQVFWQTKRQSESRFGLALYNVTHCTSVTCLCDCLTYRSVSVDHLLAMQYVINQYVSNVSTATDWVYSGELWDGRNNIKKLVLYSYFVPGNIVSPHSCLDLYQAKPPYVQILLLNYWIEFIDVVKSRQII